MVINTNIYAFWIYGYVYVGKTDVPKFRHRQHCVRPFNRNFNGYHYFRSKIIRECFSSPDEAIQGTTLEIIDMVPSDQWIETESQWIKIYKEEFGDYLLNISGGGKGVGSGEDNPTSKLTWEDVNRIRYSDPRTPKQWAEIYGISPSQIGCILLNKSWYDENYTPRSSQGGEFHYATSLSWEEVYFIRIHCHEYTDQQMADFLGKCGRKAINNIVNNKSWVDPSWSPISYEYTGEPKLW